MVAWYRPTRADARVSIRTSWEGFAPREMNVASDGWRALFIEPPSGEQTYAIVEDGAFRTDAVVPTTAYATIDGALREVTWIESTACARVTKVESVTVSPTGEVEIVSNSTSARIGDRALPIESGRVKVTLPPGKHRIVLDGTRQVPVWVGRAWDWRDAVIYEAMVDRFTGTTPSPISARAGGTLEGLKNKLDSLQSLGVNTLWLTPLYENPTGDFPGLDGRPYSGYHGYWPKEARKISSALGGEAALDNLVNDAHRRGMRVIFDVVPNHAHEQHPYVAQHPDWFIADRCVCGTAKCPWGEGSLTCVFAPYLPDVDWRSGEAARAFADDVAWWIDRFDGDGVRIDAVPLMPRSAIRRIAYTLRSRFDHAANKTLVLGEIFTDSAGYDALRFFMGPPGLDSSFEFPLMWSLRAALADRSAGMSTVDATIRAGITALSDAGVMSLILGNHDVPRFTSVANGDGARDGWDPAPQPTDPAIYQQLTTAFGILFALPGMPTIYYGDEVGLAGGGDPDSRRVMPTTIADTQKSVRDGVAAFARARACLTSLRRAAYQPIGADNERIVFSRGEVIVVATRASTVRLESPMAVSGEYVDVLSGSKRTFEPRSAFEEPAGVRYYVPAGHACATAAK
jgi:glycosidase